MRSMPYTKTVVDMMPKQPVIANAVYSLSVKMVVSLAPAAPSSGVYRDERR